jgi:hypothetical protein
MTRRLLGVLASLPLAACSQFVLVTPEYEVKMHRVQINARCTVPLSPIPFANRWRWFR